MRSAEISGVAGHFRRTLERTVATWPLWALAFGAVAIFHVPAWAHHSFGAYYLEADTVELEGEVVEFQYKNPHSWIFVAAQDAFGPRKVYAAEWAGVSRLESDGITKTTLHPGDRVRLWVSPGRDPNDNRVRLKRIERTDGWKWGQTRRQER